MAKLKMVSGKTYSCPLFGDRIVAVGEEVEVDDAVAHHLLDDKWTDSLGNEHNYFERAKGSKAAKAAPVVQEPEEEEEEEPEEEEEDEEEEEEEEPDAGNSDTAQTSGAVETKTEEVKEPADKPAPKARTSRSRK